MPNGHSSAADARSVKGGFRDTVPRYVYLMLARLLHTAGLRSWHLQAASLGSVGLCIGLWIRAKTVDQDERGNAERRALFVGLWPPMFWLIGDSIQEHE
jgi:hypothetical protein